MPEEVTNTVKTSSDGSVKISVEAYHDLLAKAAAKPPVIQKTIHKTPEMLAKEYRVSGATLMGLGVSLFVVGAIRFKAGSLPLP